MKTVPELTNIVFFMVALLLGVGFGTMFPAFNTLFVNLAPTNQRGTEMCIRDRYSPIAFQVICELEFS